MKGSLRVKIMMLFVAAASLALSLAGVSSYQTAKTSVLQSRQAHAQLRMQKQSQALSAWLSERLAELSLMSRTEMIRFGSDEARLDYLKQELVRTGGHYVSFGLSDLDGRLLQVNGADLGIAADPSFAGNGSGSDVVSNPFTVAFAQQPVIAIQVPVYDDGFQIHEILHAYVLAEQAVERFAGEKSPPDDDSFVLFQEDGNIVYPNPPDRKDKTYLNIGDARSPYQSIASDYPEHSSGLAETKLEGQTHFIAYSEVPGTDWYLAADLPEKALGEPLRRLLWKTILTMTLTGAALAVIMLVIMNYMLKRLRQILNITERAAGASLRVEPADSPSQDEIGALAQSVHDMVGRLSPMIERLNAILNQNDYAVIVVDPGYKVTYFNRTAEKILGYAAEEVLYKKTLFLWHDEQELFKRAERLSIELGERVPPDISVFMTKPLRPNPEDDQWTFIHKNGARFPVSLSISPMRDSNGLVTGFVGIARDISDYKQAEETRNRLLSILDAAKDLIASVDDRGRIFYMNPAGMELLGIDELSEDNRNTKQYFDSFELAQFVAGLEHVSKKGYWEHETVVRTRRGEQIPMSTILVAHKDKQGKVYYSVIARDILEQKRTQRELVEAKRAADRANEAKSRFLARMSHEIRTPLNGVIGFSQLLLRAGVNGGQREYANKIISSSQMLLRIVNDILDFSKVEAGKLELERTRFSLNDTVRHISDMMSVLLGKEAVEVFIDTPEELPEAVIGDPVRLEQVMLNLCGNALKFTKEGTIVVKLAWIRQQADEVWIEFAVEDTGIGIEPAQLNRLFEPFRQADESTSRKYGGTGLGLVISKNLIELMGGTLEVQSQAGAGSRFAFRLPFEPADAANGGSMPPPEAAAPDSEHAYPSCTTVIEPPVNVLLVVPNGMIRSRIGAILESFSLHVTMAGSWEESRILLQYPAARHYHLALLDMEAEDMYGIETWLEFHELLSRAGTIAIAVTTAYGREEIWSMPPEQRPDWILVKPLYRLALYQLVCAALEKRQPLSPEPEAVLSPPPAEKPEAGGSIVLAEDNEMNRQVAVEMLRSEGYSVTAVPDGLRLLELLEQRPGGWELILMDIQMPEMDGYEAARLIRADPRFNKVPIVALTANVLPEEREACFAAGMNAVLNKPVDMKELAALLPRGQRADAAVYPDAQTALPKLYGIDGRRLLEQLNGNLPIALHLLDKFRKDYAHFITELSELIRQEAWERAERKLHTLRGVAANLAADRLFQAAGRMEAQLHEKSAGNWEQELSGIRQEMERILLSLGPAGADANGQE